MKNHQQSLSESVITQVSYFSQNNPQQTNNPLCQLNNNATHVCTNQKCTKPAFICEIKDCQCRKQHQKCFKLEIESLVENIASNQVLIESLETCINDGVEQIIDMLSTYRDETITKMKKDFEFFGLSQNEKEFIKEVKDGKCENITGSKIWQIINSEREREGMNIMMEQTCKSLRREFQKSKQSFELTVNEAKSEIKKLEVQVEQFLGLQSKEDILNCSQIHFDQSKIMTSFNQFQNIQEERRQRRQDLERPRREHNYGRLRGEKNREYIRRPIMLTKIQEISPGDEELNFLAKVISIEAVGNGKKVRVVLGDETAIVKAFLFVNEHVKVGESVVLLGAEARVIKKHIEIHVPRKGKIYKARKQVEQVNERVDISVKEWIRAQQ